MDRDKSRGRAKMNTFNPEFIVCLLATSLIVFGISVTGEFIQDIIKKYL